MPSVRSNQWIRVILSLLMFVVALVGFAWSIARTGTFRFAGALALTLGGYATLLLAYLTYRRVVSRWRRWKAEQAGIRSLKSRT